MNDERKKRVVVVGGGTGTYTVLRGLKQYADQIDITAIVGMTDSGGSTGRLRDEFGYLPVGDVRMALTALAPEKSHTEELIRKLFLLRFASNGDIGGHNFGNLFLIALTDILGSEEEAILAASQVLRIEGMVIPVTNTKVHLQAIYDDGSMIVGEHAIECVHDEGGIKRITELTTTDIAHINPRAEEALKTADLIVFGPGDLYTSIIANCVIHGFKEALAATQGEIMYVSNLMTRCGQTTHMGIGAHVAELEKYIHKKPTYVVVNTEPLPEDLLQKYEAEGEYPVHDDLPRDAYCVYAQDFLAGEVVTQKTAMHYEEVSFVTIQES